MGFGRVTIMDFLSASLWILLLCPAFLVSSYELPKNPEFQFVTARTEENNISQEQEVNSERVPKSGNSITEDGASSRSFLVSDFPNHGSPDFERGPNPPRNLQTNLDSNPNFNKYLNLDRIQNTPNFDRGLDSEFSGGHHHLKFSGGDRNHPNRPDVDERAISSSGRNPNFERSGSPHRNPNFGRLSSNHRNPNFGRPSSSPRSPNFEGSTFEGNQNLERHSNFLNSDRNGNSPNFDGSTSNFQNFKGSPNFDGSTSNFQNFKGSPSFDNAPNPQSFELSRNSGRNPQPKPEFNRNFSPSNLNGGSNFERYSNFDDRPNSDRNPNFDQMVADSTQNQYSNLYRHPKAKVNRQLKFEPNDDDRDFKGQSNDIDENPDWSSTGGGKNPKTFPMPSLPTLDIIEDPGYDHNRPKWPLNEYLTDKFNSFYRPNFFGGTRSNKTHEATKQYEWQQLKPLSNSYGSGSSSFDRNKYFNLDDDEGFRNRHRHGHASSLQGYRYADDTREQHPPLNGHSTTVSTMTDVKGSASENSERGKYGYSSAYGQPHYFPPDHYPKKRFRLSIHPGYIAAPLAGIAAFGAASALTKKPLLFELGLVNNKHQYAQNYPHQGGVHYPGHGWASTVMPVVPGHGHIGAPIINSGNPSPNPTFPVLKPEASQVLHGHHLHHHHHSYPNRQHGHHHGYPHHHNHGHHNHGHHNHGHHNHGHHHHTTEQDKKPWWNPFAALTPRD